MRKYVSITLLCLMALIMASCSKNTPSGAVEKALTALQKEDSNADGDQRYERKTNTTPEAKAQEKEQFAQRLKEKYAQNPNGKMSGFKVLSGEIINDSTAKVQGELSVEKGKKETENFTCRTDESGKWRLQQNK